MHAPRTLVRSKKSLCVCCTCVCCECCMCVLYVWVVWCMCAVCVRTDTHAPMRTAQRFTLSIVLSSCPPAFLRNLLIWPDWLPVSLRNPLLSASPPVGVTVLFHCLSVDRGTGDPNLGPQICSLRILSISPVKQRSPSLPSLKNKIRQNKAPWSTSPLSSPRTFTTHPSFDS